MEKFRQGDIIYNKDDEGNLSVCIYKGLTNNSQFSVYCGVNSAGIYAEDVLIWGHVEDYKLVTDYDDTYKYLFDEIVKTGKYFDCSTCQFKRLKFRVGDLVRRIDGDGRAHEIDRIDIQQGFKTWQRAYPVFHFKDGGVEYDDIMLRLIKRYGYGDK